MILEVARVSAALASAAEALAAFLAASLSARFWASRLRALRSVVVWEV